MQKKIYLEFYLRKQLSRKTVDLFQPSIAFHIETSHLIWKTDQMTGFYVKCKTGLKYANE